MAPAPEMESQSMRTGRPFTSGRQHRMVHETQESRRLPSDQLCLLLIQQELFNGVRQRQRGDQMKAVFAKSSSHGHAAQTQQGPWDAWRGQEETDQGR